MIQGTPTISIEDPMHPDAQGLIRQLSAELAVIYGNDVPGAFVPSDVRVPRAAFVVVRVDGMVVGCGAIRPFTDDPESVEVKRMFVVPEARGQGISHLILGKLEELAASFGYADLKLETGNRQTEAIGLYEKSGYERIPCYGKYATTSWSVCFRKRLDR